MAERITLLLVRGERSSCHLECALRSRLQSLLDVVAPQRSFAELLDQDIANRPDVRDFVHSCHLRFLI
jgi:hypothetical protein